MVGGMVGAWRGRVGGGCLECIPSPRVFHDGKAMPSPRVLHSEKLCHRHAFSTMWLLYRVLQWFKGVRPEFREFQNSSKTNGDGIRFQKSFETLGDGIRSPKTLEPRGDGIIKRGTEPHR